jgi:hypothetical protein
MMVMIKDDAGVSKILSAAAVDSPLQVTPPDLIQGRGSVIFLSLYIFPKARLKVCD